MACDLGTLAQDPLVEIKAPIAADEPQDINDVATVSSDSTDTDFDNNDDWDSVTFTFGMADLFVKKICNTDPVRWDTETIHCTVIVQNSSGETAGNVVLADKLTPINQLSIVDPAVVVLDPLPAGCVATSVGEPYIIECDLDDLAPGEQRELAFTFKANEPTDAENTVLVSSDADDPNTANNEDQVSLAFEGGAVEAVEIACAARPEGQPATS